MTQDIPDWIIGHERERVYWERKVQATAYASVISLFPPATLFGSYRFYQPSGWEFQCQELELPERDELEESILERRARNS